MSKSTMFLFGKPINQPTKKITNYLFYLIKVVQQERPSKQRK